MHAIEALSPEDLKSIGLIAAALEGNDVSSASKVISDSFNGANYDYGRIGNVDVGLRAELSRRGIEEKWNVRFAYGPDHGEVQIQDWPNRLAAAKGQENVSYSVPIGTRDK